MGRYPIDRRNKRNMRNSSNKPEAVFKVGAVRASVFRNTISQQGKEVTLPKVVLEVRYKDKAGEWQSTNSFSLNELPKAILALEKAYDYLTMPKEPSGMQPSDQPKSTNFTASPGLPPQGGSLGDASDSPGFRTRVLGQW